MQRLPSEIHAVVLSHVPLESLLACSLVCSAWSALAIHEIKRRAAAEMGSCFLGTFLSEAQKEGVRRVLREVVARKVYGRAPDASVRALYMKFPPAQGKAWFVAALAARVAAAIPGARVAVMGGHQFFCSEMSSVVEREALKIGARFRRESKNCGRVGLSSSGNQRLKTSLVETIVSNQDQRANLDYDLILISDMIYINTNVDVMFELACDENRPPVIALGDQMEREPSIKYFENFPRSADTERFVERIRGPKNARPAFNCAGRISREDYATVGWEVIPHPSL